MTSASGVIAGSGAQRRDTRPLTGVPSTILASLITVVCEAMFFLGLISAWNVISAGADNWVPPENIRLPVTATAFNTMVLFASAVFIQIAAHRQSRGQSRARIEAPFALATLLGAFFVLAQGYEWVQLISAGMNVKTSLFGATFFLLVGMHGLHAAGSVLAMVWLWQRRIRAGNSRPDQLRAMQIFWYFVVGIWPLLYSIVYF